MSDQLKQSEVPIPLLGMPNTQTLCDALIYVANHKPLPIVHLIGSYYGALGTSHEDPPYPWATPNEVERVYWARRRHDEDIMSFGTRLGNVLLYWGTAYRPDNPVSFVLPSEFRGLRVPLIHECEKCWLLFGPTPDWTSYRCYKCQGYFCKACHRKVKKDWGWTHLCDLCHK